MIGAARVNERGLVRSPQTSEIQGATSAIQSTQTGPFGGACLSLGGIGTGDNLYTRRSAPNMFNGNGTAEFWFINLGTNYNASYNLIYDQQEVSTEIALILRNNNTLAARARFGANTLATAYGALNSIGTWNHVAITLDDDVYLTLWINGNKVGTVGNGTDTLVTSGGQMNRLHNNSYDGYYAEFRLSTIARYDRANSTYTVPTARFENDQYTYWLFHCDAETTNREILDDTTPYARTAKSVVPVGTAAMSTNTAKFGEYAMRFPASTATAFPYDHNYAEIVDWSEDAYSDSWDSLDTWIYYVSGGTGSHRIIDHEFLDISVTSAGQISVSWIDSNSNSGSFSTSGTALTANAWNHLRIVYNFGSTCSIYFNGTRVYNGSPAIDPDLSSITVGYIGDYSPSLNNIRTTFVMYLQDFLIYDGQLNAVTDTTITVPTAPINPSDLDPTKVILHIPANDGVFRDDNSDYTYPTRGTTQAITKNGVAVTSADAKVGNTSIGFPGSTYAYVGVPGNWSPVIPATGDFTIEFWFKVNNVTQRHDFIGQGYPTGGNGRLGMSLRYPEQDFSFFLGSTTNLSLLSGVLNANTWYHIAATRSGDLFTLYVDGTSVDSGSVSQDISQLDPTLLGNVISQYPVGYMDEIRISNTVRYTGNFTPAVERYIPDSNTLLLVHGDALVDALR